MSNITERDYFVEYENPKAVYNSNLLHVDETDQGNRPKAFSTTDLYRGPPRPSEGPRSRENTPPSGSPRIQCRDLLGGHVQYRRLPERKPRSLSQPSCDQLRKWNMRNKGRSIEEILKEPRMDIDDVSGRAQRRIRLRVIKIESTV